MYRLEEFISMIDGALDTKAKRHLAGGVLMSVSLLFGGLALTIITLRTEEKSNERYIE
jgi:hypothetical protein